MVIAIHSTALGPALGGTRMALYADSADPSAAAYSDALRLSRAMTYKNALAGLDHGGGKAVILADPSTQAGAACTPTAASWTASPARTSPPATSA